MAHSVLKLPCRRSCGARVRRRRKEKHELVSIDISWYTAFAMKGTYRSQTRCVCGPPRAANLSARRRPWVWLVAMVEEERISADLVMVCGTRKQCRGTPTTMIQIVGHNDTHILRNEHERNARRIQSLMAFCLKIFSVFSIHCACPLAGLCFPQSACW